MGKIYDFHFNEYTQEKQSLSNSVMEQCKSQDLMPWKIGSIESITRNGHPVKIQDIKPGDEIIINGGMIPMHANYLGHTQDNVFGPFIVDDIGIYDDDFVFTTRDVDGDRLMMTTVAFNDTWKSYFIEDLAKSFIHAGTKELHNDRCDETKKVLSRIGITVPETADARFFKRVQLLFSQENYIDYFDKLRGLDAIKYDLVNKMEHLHAKIGQLIQEHTLEQQLVNETPYRQHGTLEALVERWNSMNERQYPDPKRTLGMRLDNDVFPRIYSSDPQDIESFDSEERSLQQYAAGTDYAHYRLAQKCFQLGFPVFYLPPEEVGNIKKAGFLGQRLDPHEIKPGMKIKLPTQCIDIITKQPIVKEVEVKSIASKGGHLVLDTTAGLISTRDYSRDIGMSLKVGIDAKMKNKTLHTPLDSQSKKHKMDFFGLLKYEMPVRPEDPKITPIYDWFSDSMRQSFSEENQKAVDEYNAQMEKFDRRMEDFGDHLAEHCLRQGIKIICVQEGQPVFVGENGNATMFIPTATSIDAVTGQSITDQNNEFNMIFDSSIPFSNDYMMLCQCTNGEHCLVTSFDLREAAERICERYGLDKDAIEQNEQTHNR